MLFYSFDTEQEALTAAEQIIDNVRSWALEYSPAALSEDQQKLRGRNAATNELVDVYTVRWALPFQIPTGKWVFLKPTQAKTNPIPVGVFIAGIIGATDVEYDANWFETENEEQ